MIRRTKPLSEAEQNLPKFYEIYKEKEKAKFLCDYAKKMEGKHYKQSFTVYTLKKDDETFYCVSDLWREDNDSYENQGDTYEIIKKTDFKDFV